MLPSAQALSYRYLQRHARLRSLTIRRNRFLPPHKQLSLFQAHDSGKYQIQPRANRLTLAFDRLYTMFNMKIIQWWRSNIA